MSNRNVRGPRDSIPAGSFLGRLDAGNGPVSLVDITDISHMVALVLTGRSPFQSGGSASPGGGQDIVIPLLEDSTEIDFTYDGAEVTASIFQNSVVVGRLHFTATQRLVGRWSAGAGEGQEITLGSGIALSGSGVLSATGTGGTVTSVGLSAPAEFTVSGSPVTTSGTLTFVWATELANVVLAGPASGGAAVPAFRALVVADIPTLLSTKISDFTEAAQDATGAMVDSTLVYVDATPLLTRAALTGDITAPQASNATTLTTVNANVGSFGSATQVMTQTVNAKGLTTAAANVTIAIPSTQITDFTEAAQDATGAMAANSTRVTLTYVDATPSLTADLVLDTITVGYVHFTTTTRLLGRTTASAGAGEEISVGTGLSLTGGSLSSTITQYTDEMAQDAVGAMVDTTLVYVDATPLLTRAALTGDITAPQASNATTLATVNANVGSFGSATQVMTQTVNAKGLTTAAANVSIAIPSTQVTDFTEAAQDATGAMVDASLVYVDATPLLTRAALTGDATASQGSNALTLATVNANVGSFGSATQVMTQTVNAKGLTTAAANVSIAIPSTQVTDFTEAAQDATGAMATNSARVTLTYSDPTPSLAADLVLNTITVGYLSAAASPRLFGRTTAGAGAGEELTVSGVGLTLAAGALAINALPQMLAVQALG